MKKINFRIDAIPVPKGRPRFTRSGHAYTPAKTRAYEKLIGKKAEIVIYDEPDVNLSAPVEVTVRFGMPIPKSWSKKKTTQALFGEIAHTKKPDIDNLQKCLLDGCNGILWNDDSQIIKISASKFYSDVPFTEVEVIYTDWKNG